MSTADQLNEELRRRCRFHTILSACWGSLAGALIAQSAVMILYATALGAGDMLSLVTTALGSLSSCLLLIPAAVISNRFGYKKTIIHASLIGAAMLILAALAPIFGDAASHVLLLALAVYSISITFYAASWFPLLDGFLRPEDRSHYFGRMRFSWQMTATVFLFICGILIGRNPPLWTLRVIIAICAVGLLGRIIHIRMVPPVKQEDKPVINLKSGLLDIIANKPLTGFSIYICFLYLAAWATPAVTFLYIKKALFFPDNAVIIISACSLAGNMCGFFAAGYLIERFRIKWVLLAMHFSFALLNIMLFFTSGTSLATGILIGTLITFYGFAIACSSVAVSSEMLALASPDHRALSMAFLGSFCAAGTGGSGLLSSLILGSGALSSKWNIGNFQFTQYQTLFLLYAVSIMFVCLLLVLVPAIFPGKTRATRQDAIGLR